MSAVATLPTFAETPLEAANIQASVWRAKILDAFTHGEAAIASCLTALAAAGPRGRAIQLPNLIGQRVEVLSKAIGASGPFANEGTATQAAAALERFRTHLNLRNLVCHGVGSVRLRAGGGWAISFNCSTLRPGQSETIVRRITDAEAAQLLNDLTHARSKLGSQLGQLKKLLKAFEPAVTPS